MKIILCLVILLLAGCDLRYSKDEMTNIVQQKFPNSTSVTLESGESNSYIWIAKDSTNAVYKISSESTFKNRFNPVAVKILP